MSFTVVPLHLVDVPPGTRIPFGPDFVFEEIPDWLKQDKGIINDLGLTERQLFSAATHAFVAEYEALSLGSPDPSWTGPKPKGIQNRKFQAAMLANFALWLRQPSPACFTSCFHAISWKCQDQPQRIPIVQQVQHHTRLFNHPKDAGNPLTPSHIAQAAPIYAALAAILTDNPVWEATRFFWEALTTYRSDFRYTSFWIGMEALFGPNDAGETTYKICQRVAFLLAESPQDARELFRKAKNCYATRSKIVHGRWKHDPKITDAMADTEALVRAAFRKLLADPQMLKVFISKKRDAFLEDWVFSRSTDTPPFPE